MTTDNFILLWEDIFDIGAIRFTFPENFIVWEIEMMRDGYFAAASRHVSLTSRRMHLPHNGHVPYEIFSRHAALPLRYLYFDITRSLLHSQNEQTTMELLPTTYDDQRSCRRYRHMARVIRRDDFRESWISFITRATTPDSSFAIIAWLRRHASRFSFYCRRLLRGLMGAIVWLFETLMISELPAHFI